MTSLKDCFKSNFVHDTEDDKVSETSIKTEVTKDNIKSKLADTNDTNVTKELDVKNINEHLIGRKVEDNKVPLIFENEGTNNKIEIETSVITEDKIQTDRMIKEETGTVENQTNIIIQEKTCPVESDIIDDIIVISSDESDSEFSENQYEYERMDQKRINLYYELRAELMVKYCPGCDEEFEDQRYLDRHLHRCTTYAIRKICKKNFKYRVSPYFRIHCKHSFQKMFLYRNHLIKGCKL